MTHSINATFTPKHKRLAGISTMANIFSWLILLFNVIQAILRFLQFWKLSAFRGLQSILEMFREFPETTANLFLSVFNILLFGVVCWIVLKGVSLGLNMIIETDLNNPNLKKTGELLEIRATDSQAEINPNNAPVFYKPKQVVWLNLWLNRLSTAFVVITVIVSIPEIFRMQRVVFSYFSVNPNWNFVSWLIALVGGGLAIAIQCFIVYFSLRAFAYILRILMEMEFKSRAAE